MNKIRISDVTMTQTGAECSLSFKEKIELCKLLEGLTGYRAPFLQEVMDEQIEDAMDMYGSPISGITNTLAVALELDI